MQQPGLESAARELIERRLGGVLRDADWCRMRKRLLDFAIILCDWDRERKIEAGREDPAAELCDGSAGPKRQAA